MQTTDVKDNLKKDKSKERDPNFPQKQAPHLSDCFDNFIFQCLNYLISGDWGYGLGNAFGVVQRSLTNIWFVSPGKTLHLKNSTLIFYLFDWNKLITKK